MACFSSQPKAFSLSEKSGTVFLAGMAGCGEAQGLQDGKMKSMDFGGSYIPHVVDGLQISSPL